MNIVHEPKTAHSFVGKLTTKRQESRLDGLQAARRVRGRMTRINSGAIARVCCLGFGDFTSHARHPELISTSLGEKHVVEWTVRQINNAAFDDVAALLDTDKDWTPAVAKKTKLKKIVVFASDPCFEAVLLWALGKHPVGDAKALKRTIAPYVKNDATIRENYQEHFGDKQLQVARTREVVINELLKALGK